MQARVLKHVEDLEYRKQSAREYAKDVVDELDVKDILNDDPDRVIDSILAALVIFLLPLARAAGRDAAGYAVDLGLAPLAEGTVDSLVDDAESAFLADARQPLFEGLGLSLARIQDALDEGVDVATIQKAVATEDSADALLAPLYGALKRYGAGFIQGVERDVNDAALEGFRSPSTADAFAQATGDAPPELTWIAVVDQRTCRGELEHACYPRHAVSMTLREWRKKGLPGSSVLLCSMYAPRGASPCRCSLADPEKAAGIVVPVQAAKAVKAGRERAIADAQKRRAPR